ncbi:MAG: hypothetical protein LBI82_03865 [Dysgonamonadaceae bacterium]|jgi:hypothetical protein|nr:hypothetical protein [Dysgonamonadaceae bacterium]
MRMICICNILDWLNLIVTSILTIVIIVITFRLGRRQNQISEGQNELQKRISDDQNDLQKLLAEKDVKVALYQHRMNCYMQVMQALDVIIYAKLEDTLDVFNRGNIVNALNKVSEGRSWLLRACVESEALFNQDIITHFEVIYKKYDKLYSIFCDILMIPSEGFNKRRVLIATAIGVLPTDSDSDILLKYHSFMKSEGSRDVMIKIFPELKEYSSILDELKDYYQSNNKLFQMMKEYIQIEKIRL